MAFTDRRDLDERDYRTLVQMIQGQAYRELLAAQMFGFGLQFVPRLDWLEFMTWHIREETDHYRRVARMFHDLTGESVEPIVAARLREKPVPFAQSWYELAMAQFLYDRGGLWQLSEYDACSFVPYRRMVETIIQDERGHQAFGQRIVVTLTRTGEHEHEKQAIFEKWLRHGLLSFGRPGTEASKYAVERGFKKRDAGAVMRDFIDDIKPAVKACGLVFPRLESIGIVSPPGLDLSLDGVGEVAAEAHLG